MRSTFRPLLTALALAALAPAGAARADSPPRPSAPPPAARPPPPGSERVEIQVQLPPWQNTGRFALEVGGERLDHGTVRDSGGFNAGDGVVRRVLEGERGTLVLKLAMGGHSPSFFIFGRWSIVSGTGDWARLAGEGTFTSCSNGEARGSSPFAQQVLLGHVVGLRP